MICVTCNNTNKNKNNIVILFTLNHFDLAYDTLIILILSLSLLQAKFNILLLLFTTNITVDHHMSFLTIHHH